ncbi:glycosyltransferase family 39 protein [Tsukamurella sp. PLM1]|uniref:ArnT family glycosyltransferase n=1 Tax=Tsukamurella sp. PLM1 TaxID=2929795 RepID=UPI0020BD917C|nr:glycosyltransferase family 39 protein [Tsukamurella sp. PLM1]
MSGAPPPPVARRHLALIGSAVLVVMLLGSRNYGYFFDEAYFVVAGREHPAAGYFDQPPLVPLLAAGLDHLAHGNLVVLRLPATLAVVANTLLTGLLARELGGRAGAQAFAAAAVAMSLVSSVGHWLATYSLDPLWWTVILYLLVRWVRTRADRLLLLAGAVTALSLLTKFLVPALWVAVAVGALACGPRRLLTRPALWAGAALAVVAVAPTLWWQAGHDWAYTRMGAVVRAEWPGGTGFALVGLFGAGLLIGLPLLLAGVVALLRSRDLRPYRFLGVALVLVVAAIVLTHGRAYYLASVYALPMAAGAVVAEGWLARRGRRPTASSARSRSSRYSAPPPAGSRPRRCGRPRWPSGSGRRCARPPPCSSTATPCCRSCPGRSSPPTGPSRPRSATAPSSSPRATPSPPPSTSSAATRACPARTAGTARTTTSAARRPTPARCSGSATRRPCSTGPSSTVGPCRRPGRPVIPSYTSTRGEPSPGPSCGSGCARSDAPCRRSVG